MSLKAMDILDLHEALKLLSVSQTKDKLFAKFFPNIENVEDYSVVLPESFREFESRYEWILIDKYMPENKAYAVNTKGILAPPPFKPLSFG